MSDATPKRSAPPMPAALEAEVLDELRQYYADHPDDPAPTAVELLQRWASYESYLTYYLGPRMAPSEADAA